jgi:hypothetical protein
MGLRKGESEREFRRRETKRKLQQKMLDGCERCSGWKLPCSACQRNYKRDMAKEALKQR